MFLTVDDRKRIFEDGRDAAAHNHSRSSCPYLTDESPERLYIWLGGYDERLTQEGFRSGTGIRS